MSQDIWKDLHHHTEDMQQTSLNELFQQNDQRADQYQMDAASIAFDFSKTHINDQTLALFGRLTEASGFENWKSRLMSGAVVNPSEHRPALHHALRLPQGSSHDLDTQLIQVMRNSLTSALEFADAIRSGDIKSPSGKAYQHILHIGIGGSALGPQLILDTLNTGDNAIKTHIVANIDGHALQSALSACEPESTLIIATSKTFTTIETLTNLLSALRWLSEQGVAHPMQQVVAVTASPAKALEMGIPGGQTFTFDEAIGGRYSLWSTVSLVAMIKLGSKTFMEFMDGAARMDAHFASAAPGENVPLFAALLDVYYASFWKASTRAVFAYDHRLATLVPYLQQLEMESNGKDRNRHGEAISWPTAPIVWGGVGTDAQHAVFQLMHQGTHCVPAEFIAVISPDHPLSDHHRWQLANCFAQSAALMRGRSTEEALQEVQQEAQQSGVQDPDQQNRIAQAKTFSGNRPSVTLLLPKLDAGTLGALLAFYEHRTFAAGVLWQINSFDQMGVELGKQLAKSLESALRSGDYDTLEADSSTQNLLKRVAAEFK